MDNPYQAPRGEIITPSGGQNPTTWKEILFSFKGRIPRRQYWGGTGIITLAALPLFLIVFLVGETESGALSLLGGLIGIVAYIGIIWASFALGSKRWHDRDQSGWWMLFAFLPIIGAIWAFVEQGCLRGTEGPNRFGDDPT